MANHDELRDRLDGDDRLGRFLRETREQLCTPPPDDVARRHQLLLAQAAREAAHVAPTTTTARPERGASWGQRLRRVAGLTSVKLAVTGAAALAATGGLAATDSLPEPAQRVVSQVADRVGIDLPNPDDVPAGPAADGRPDGVEPGAPDQVPPVDVPAPGDATETGGEHAEDDTPPADGDLPEESDRGTGEADERTPDDVPATDAPPDDTPATDAPPDEAPATDAPPEGTAPDGTPPTEGEVPPEQAGTGTGEAGERTPQDVPPADTPSERPGEGP